ncbi:MAG TPA: putative metalloprotease CJM1_0395 family protein [Rhodocyclaceae bacterium]|jgi:hypothetical protein|nr:putative metalloprotease CJM1_0395 family protein [Rhodocyclaceae bacterium]
MHISGFGPVASLYDAFSAGRAKGRRAPDPSDGRLSAEDEEVIRKLKARDQEVRRHEQAHIAAAGGLAVSGAGFTYQRGPDGVNYAVGGEVTISTAPGRTPEETLRRADAIRRAALAPADPSGQDHAVAAAADQMAREALMELTDKAREVEPEDDRRAAVERAYGAIAGPPSSQIKAYA